MIIDILNRLEKEGVEDKPGYFKGKGLATPAKEIVARVRELLQEAGYTTV